VSLQPFVGPRHRLQFRNHFYTDDRTPWTSDQSVARPLPTYRRTHRTNTHADIHVLTGIRTHYPNIRAGGGSSFLRPRGHCDRPITSTRSAKSPTTTEHQTQCTQKRLHKTLLQIENFGTQTLITRFIFRINNHKNTIRKK
jgi:hypothetical protein